ncbi:DNA cytosine methyltransferase [Paenirhodobacter enshiensis]|uniref:DNA (cytosine-5-)-methyltransferase n=1 Tax=Paenirhodobacter enshiensis TaxID=1105367 RepID=A0A086Y1G7_9RHOB|nr:DNA cytosine methyltransferase [Paenirhodobacter enshiensis]KFI28117.1 modification methylase [Paenirhodobacter enshiensis]
MSGNFGIIDLFAGPGGLGEGFSAAGRETDTRMKIRLSIEKEEVEVRTLRLRAFLRGFEAGFPDEYYAALNAGKPLPDWSELHPSRWADACDEARRMELGQPGVFDEIAGILDRTREGHGGKTILIGGPPCQAYSLAGRSRNKGVADYVPEHDRRHYLYREYVSILDRLRPAVFVMENVKGLLSSKVDGGEIFDRVLDDLRKAGDGYKLMPLSAPRHSDDYAARDFIVHAEEHGVPQARHRVFIVGIRADLPLPEGTAALMPTIAEEARSTVGAVLSDLPALRSGLSRQRDDATAWREVVFEHAEHLVASQEVDGKVRKYLVQLERDGLARATDRRRSAFRANGRAMSADLAEWLIDPRLQRMGDHETRSHIAADLGRYLFVAAFGHEHGRSPKLSEFPSFLLPDHRNRDTGAFADRFRVQIAERPSTTVTSHISKDGHYFIHPDPSQVRSLTVREAARLQTFPDNYVFCGNRTQQYHQVGNAVPPFLALRIARVIREIVGRF